MVPLKRSQQMDISFSCKCGRIDDKGRMKNPVNRKRKIMNNPFVPTLAFLLVLLCGCGAPLPTEYGAKQALLQDNLIDVSNEQKINFGECFTLLSFHKTGGQFSVVNGVKFYKLKFECEAEFRKDCIWKKAFFQPAVVSSILSQKFIEDCKREGSFVKTGVRQKMTGDVAYEKLETGWEQTGLHWARAN